MADDSSNRPPDPLDPLARHVAGTPRRARTPAPPIDPADGFRADPLAPATGDASLGGPPRDDPSHDDTSLDDPSLDLTAEDRDLLVALAAFQLRYGEDAEALAYLLAARLVFPSDADVLRLLAHALVKVGRADEADEVLAELDRVVRPPPPLALLSRALVRLAQGRLAEARRLFAQYRERGEADPYDRAA